MTTKRRFGDQGFGSWPGESNGAPRTGGDVTVLTPEHCTVCGEEIETAERLATVLSELAQADVEKWGEMISVESSLEAWGGVSA